MKTAEKVILRGRTAASNLEWSHFDAMAATDAKIAAPVATAAAAGRRANERQTFKPSAQSRRKWAFAFPARPLAVVPADWNQWRKTGSESDQRAAPGGPSTASKPQNRRRPAGGYEAAWAIYIEG
jgi:hypothetical protein